MLSHNHRTAILTFFFSKCVTTDLAPGIPQTSALDRAPLRFGLLALVQPQLDLVNTALARAKQILLGMKTGISSARRDDDNSVVQLSIRRYAVQT